jgi:hypothetical protein
MANNPIIVGSDDDKVFDLVHEGNKLLILQDDERMSFEANTFCDLIFMNVSVKCVAF